MALFTGCFRSQALNYDTTFNVIIPENCPSEDIPTVYLLHGMHGCYASWDRQSLVESYAKERRVAVVMPEGENGFYQDMKYGKNYFTFVTEELLDYTRRIFRLSLKRENTYICGLSMGGYGALDLAIRKPEQYAAAGSLSGCVDILWSLQRNGWPHEAACIWGDDYKTCVAGTPSDLFYMIENFPADKPKPRLYACCGRQDGLYGSNLRLRDFMADKPFEFLFEEGEGVHNWAFWNAWLPRTLDYMMQK